MGVYWGNKVPGVEKEECDQGGDGREAMGCRSQGASRLLWGLGDRWWVLGGGVTGLLWLLPGGWTCRDQPGVRCFSYFVANL